MLLKKTNYISTDNYLIQPTKVEVLKNYYILITELVYKFNKICNRYDVIKLFQVISFIFIIGKFDEADLAYIIWKVLFYSKLIY